MEACIVSVSLLHTPFSYYIMSFGSDLWEWLDYTAFLLNLVNFDSHPIHEYFSCIPLTKRHMSEIGWSGLATHISKIWKYKAKKWKERNKETYLSMENVFGKTTWGFTSTCDDFIPFLLQAVITGLPRKLSLVLFLVSLIWEFMVTRWDIIIEQLKCHVKYQERLFRSIPMNSSLVHDNITFIRRLNSLGLGAKLKVQFACTVWSV